MSVVPSLRNVRGDGVGASADLRPELIHFVFWKSQCELVDPTTYHLSPTTYSSRGLRVTNQSIFDFDAPLGERRDREVVRDDQDRVALLVEGGKQLQHFVSRLLVQGAGRLVGE